MNSALYNETWASTYATNDGQWRGDDHYTIRSSYISSNATDPGLCPLVIATTSVDSISEAPTTSPSSTELLTTTSTAVPVSGCATRPINLCCLNVAPWSTNAYVWGTICGYNPEDPSELVGARCSPRSTSGPCPPGSSAACCRGTLSGPNAQCGLGTQCARS